MAQNWNNLFSYPMTTAESILSDGGNFSTVSDVTFTVPLKVASGSPNQAETTTAGDRAAALYTGAVPANQYVTIASNAFASGDGFIILRAGSATSGNYYLIGWAGSAFVVYGVVAGVVTQIGSNITTN